MPHIDGPPPGSGEVDPENIQPGRRSISPRALVLSPCALGGKRRKGSMVARPAPVQPLTADAVEFVRFCYSRRKVGWPELYDEMCAVAGRGLFRGWGADELAQHGIGFGLSEMASLASEVCQIVAEDRARTKAASRPQPVTAAAGA
jgi:hypothetical protein